MNLFRQLRIYTAETAQRCAAQLSPDPRCPFQVAFPTRRYTANLGVMKTSLQELEGRHLGSRKSTFDSRLHAEPSAAPKLKLTASGLLEAQVPEWRDRRDYGDRVF